MAQKALLHLFAAFLLLTLGVHCRDDEYKTVAPYTKVPPPAPVNASPPPLVKPPISPAPPVKPPTYPAPPKTPTPTPPPPSTPAPPTQAPSAPPMMPPVPKKDCVPLCEKRCSLHSRKKVCVRACSTCCERCKCVPPGTYGNREKCGKCYTDMTTHGGRPKCP